MERKVYFTSDTHFGHGNVIRYCNRPFARKVWGVLARPSEILGKPVAEVEYEYLKANVDVDTAAMNREMVARWNSVVRPFDLVYHLGDVAMGKAHELPDHVSKLHGRKILVRGNHDRSPQKMKDAGFDEVYERLELEIDGVRVYMHHQPQVKSHWGGAQIHLCGHVHEKWKRYGDMINVGVDQWDFTPRSLQELMQADSQGSWPKASEMD
jgi:calcineurin-like phosphoesterase family protein